MFFQQFAMKVGSSDTTQHLKIVKNQNAMEMASISVRPLGNNTLANPFLAKENTIEVGLITSMPTLSASLTGVNTSQTPYWLMDFTTDKTLVFSSTCKGQEDALCTQAPIYANASFNGNNAAVSQFTELQVGGYVASGSVYDEVLCFQGSLCIEIEAYAADLILSDDWLYDQPATYGTLGMGPGSLIWSAYVDHDTL